MGNSGRVAGNASFASARLRLHPLQVSDAEMMVDVLAAPELYHFTGGSPPDLNTLRERYEMQVEGSLDEDEEWMNWIISLRETAQPIGFVQATVDTGLSVPETELAWLISPTFQRLGYATEAVTALVAWLGEHRPSVLCAKIHPDHAASQLVAASIGLQRTHVLDQSGEESWTNRSR